MRCGLGSREGGSLQEGGRPVRVGFLEWELVRAQPSDVFISRYRTLGGGTSRRCEFGSTRLQREHISLGAGVDGTFARRHSRQARVVYAAWTTRLENGTGKVRSCHMQI